VLIPITLATLIGASTQAWATDGGSSTAQPPVKMIQVFQKNLAFHPTDLILKPGDSVTWTNKEEDGTTHSVVQGNGADIDSPDIEPGQTFVWKFDKPGQWDMICRYHPAMYMTVGVVGKDGKVPPAAPYAPETPPLPASPTPPQGTVPGVTGLPIAHDGPNHRTHQ
jgi:plastocyanin